MTKVVTTDNSGNITCAAEICELISDCASIPHNKSLKVVGTELQLTDTLNDVIKCDVSNLINKPATQIVTNVKLYSDGKLLKLDDSAGDTVSNNMVTNAQACLPDLTYSFLNKTSNASGDLLILDSTGKPTKRSDLSNLADGVTITYNQASGKLSAVQPPSTPAPTYVHASDIPAESKSDTYPLTPAAVRAMLQYLRPTSSTSGLTAKQLSANAIDCQVFSNVTCDGSGNVTSFKIPKPGSSTGMCTVTIPTSAGGGGTTFPTTVWEGASTGCVNVPDPGIYYAELNTGLGSYFIPFVNVGNLPADTAPVNNAGYPRAWQRCLVLMVEPDTADGALSPRFYTGGIAAGRVKANSRSYYPITKIVRVC